MRRFVPIALSVAAVVAVAPPGARDGPKAPVTIRLLEMKDAQRGYALGASATSDTNAFRLLWTADGGHRWHDVTPGASVSSPVTFVGGSTRLVATTLRHAVFAVERSDDGGRTWRRSLPFRDAFGAPAVGQPFAVDSEHLYLAVGEGAAAGSSSEALFTSSDGGHRWRFVTRTQFATPKPGLLPFGCDKNGFGFATPTRGWAGAYCAGGRPFFYRTDDGGRTWHPQRLDAPSQCACDTSAPVFYGPADGVLSVTGFTTNGSGRPFVRILWTSDSGQHWRGSTPPSGRTTRPVFAGPRTVWIAAQPVGDLRAPFNHLLRTTDGGAHWQVTKLAFDAGDYLLDPVTGRLAFAVPAFPAHAILVTRDGGRSWRRVAAVSR